MLLRYLNLSQWKLVVYYATWAHFNGPLHNFLPSVVPTLQPLKLLKQNLNIAWTAAPIFTKLSKNILPHQGISTAYIVTPFLPQYQHFSLSNFWDITLILLERFYQSLWNFVCMYIWCHMKSCQWQIWQIPPISNTNTIACQIVAAIPLILLECLNRSSLNFVSISSHLRSSQLRTWENPLISSKNTTTS
jgi:hypothetical protein